MKILMVSMNSIHFRRWSKQLENSGHEVFWFDVLGSEGSVKELDWLEQKTDWRLRIKKGRYFLKKIPLLKNIINNNISDEFEKYLNKVKPDIVHSFVLYLSCAPILDIMKKKQNVKWVYSAWGNDLYYYQNFPKYKKDIDRVLPFLDYMFADCDRDLNLAKKLGFKGKSLGSYPGGGGYHLDLIDEVVKKVNERGVILIKGYQGEKHRGLNVLKALEGLSIKNPIIFFSTDQELFDYYENSTILKEMNIKFYGKGDQLSHKELCRLMNRSLIYVGNNLSDGMPNTMLEAICFGAFPIQSNPGGASAEIINDGINGLLINDCEDVNEIANKIKFALSNADLLEQSFKYNMNLRKELEYSSIRKQVLLKYKSIEKDIF